MNNKTRIIEAATELFAQVGFDGTSLQQIADAVGIRKPSLLYHFKSKEALRESVLEVALVRWNDMLPRVLTGASGSPQERFESLLGESLAYFGRNREQARLLLREMLDRPEAMAAAIADYCHPWMDLVLRAIRRGAQAGEVRAQISPVGFVRHVVGMVLTHASVGGVLESLGAQATEAGGTANARIELIRIASVSFFTPQEP